MGEEKRKETLTRANIRKDLTRHFWRVAMWLLISLAVFIALPCVYFFYLRQGIWPIEKPVYEVALVLFAASVAVSNLVYFCRLIQCFRTKLFVTTGRLISADYEESGNNGYHFTYCYLTFSGYDRYTVKTISGKTLHPWSKLYPLSAEGEYYYASEGDEYYLVLSKPHSGKILMVYNKKLFELVD